MASKAALVVMTPRSVPADILKENAKHYWPEDPRHRRPALADRWRCYLGNARKSREVESLLTTVKETYVPSYAALARAHIRSLEESAELRRLAIVSMQPGEHRRLTLPVTAI